VIGGIVAASDALRMRHARETDWHRAAGNPSAENSCRLLEMICRLTTISLGLCFLLGAVETAGLAGCLSPSTADDSDANQENLHSRRRTCSLDSVAAFRSGGTSHRLVNEEGGARTPLSTASLQSSFCSCALSSHLLNAFRNRSSPPWSGRDSGSAQAFNFEKNYGAVIDPNLWWR